MAADEPTFLIGRAPVAPAGCDEPLSAAPVTAPYADSELVAVAYPTGMTRGHVLGAARTNGLAVASLVCSLVAPFSCLLLSVLGVVFGHVARRQIRQRGESGDGLALAGLIIGWIGVCATFALVVFFAYGISGPSADYR
jgi:hypothetical protein